VRVHYKFVPCYWHALLGYVSNKELERQYLARLHWTRASVTQTTHRMSKPHQRFVAFNAAVIRSRLPSSHFTHCTCQLHNKVTTVNHPFVTKGSYWPRLRNYCLQNIHSNFLSYISLLVFSVLASSRKRKDKHCPASQRDP
jgi:hypothetical protein